MVTRNTKGERKNSNASPSAKGKGKSKATDAGPMEEEEEEEDEEEEDEEEEEEDDSGEEEGEDEEVRYASSVVWCPDSTRLLENVKLIFDLARTKKNLRRLTPVPLLSVVLVV